MSYEVKEMIKNLGIAIPLIVLGSFLKSWNATVNAFVFGMICYAAAVGIRHMYDTFKQIFNEKDEDEY